ncbi:MAG TPA: DUF3576 domain-containing protein [Magnetospirillaceae bacterium]|jgi:hypothetical protein
MINGRVRILMAIVAMAVLASCDENSDNYPVPPNPHEKTRYTKDAPQDTVFGPGGLNLFGNDSKNKGGGEGGGIGVNVYLWRATLDTVSFMPLTSADPFGGVIITDWYSPPETPNERLKLSIFILDRQLRADGLRVSVFRQVKSADGNSWVDAKVDAKTATQMEDSILARARELRVADNATKS